MLLDQTYVNLKNQAIKAERRVLKELGFCVHVKHPHKLIVVFLKYLGFDEEMNSEMLQMAWNYMNDSFRTDVFVRYQPETIACACIALSARKLNINLSTTPPWFVVFKVKEDDLIDACFRIMELYHRGKPNTDKLEAAVDELKKQYQVYKLVITIIFSVSSNFNFSIRTRERRNTAIIHRLLLQSSIVPTDLRITCGAALFSDKCHPLIPPLTQKKRQIRNQNRTEKL